MRKGAEPVPACHCLAVASERSGPRCGPSKPAKLSNMALTSVDRRPLKTIPPGQVMWLQSVGSAPRKGWRPGRSHEYRAVWIDAEDLSSEGIILSGRMMAGAEGRK